ncbi:branched-chain-amino-acid transaminase [Brevibacillus sp. 7WMA2]|uniref:Branched-chain-amino-acid aminotransferase n=1 Tax=Brevibacillus laterosporus LMG 15441 TaxID=1042163 RepID=A0A075R2G5_BRELA|nr:MULTISPECIES: branched-chain-amino-acid transaminase [Brevibacillus]AIG25606.1 branched-chain-amino-acid aminotransferase [Brevibacillus laterosporus LMG 15441]AUM64162.1 branched-chain-amino-acid transaminase [Brevibacillus laterosporus]AYK07146.1 branched-chain-amino-acid transaminase [Brevibacillus laterosporus]ERM17481.1 branched-chain amino acid aminotransferase [Brevibacillus laterosporus PE36]MCR8962118.1 branched-chain-amino-acid transaminase [Brevibacillus laterosporus]
MTQQLIYLNGEFVEKENAKISVYDHGFLYGDGIFEGIRVYNGNIFRLQEHIERLYESALSIMLVIPMKIEEMMDAVVETVRKNELRDAYIRLVISRGDGDLGLDPRSCKRANIVIIVEQLRLFPQELYETGLKIVTVPTRRNKPDALNPKIKSLNYLNNVMVRMEASMAGVSEALMLNSEGYVTEGSGDNIFLVKKGVIYTPPTYLGALDGITRQAIMDIARELGYVVKEEPFTRHDVYIADEVFLTGTAAEVISVSEVDARVIRDGKPGPVTKQLLEEFRRYVQVDGVKVYK